MRKMVEFPDILQEFLNEYEESESPKLRLWGICDFIEALIRLLCLIQINQVIETEGKNLNKTSKSIGEIKRKIEYPTVGSWFSLLKAFTNNKLIETELIKEIREKIIPFIEEDDRAIIVLRNCLAHGGGRAIDLIQVEKIWSEKFQRFIEEIHFVCEIKFEEDPVLNDKMVTKYKEQSFQVWPFIVKNEMAGVKSFYLRRDVIHLNYDSFGSADEKMHKSTTQQFSAFLELINKRATDDNEIDYRIKGINNELAKEAIQFLGRVSELEEVDKIVRTSKKSVHWIFASPGMGKSYMMAKIALDLEEQKSVRHRIYSFRFKKGDINCNKNQYMDFIFERVQFECKLHMQGWRSTKDKQVEKVTEALSALVEKQGLEFIFLIDGLDELPVKDLVLLDDILSMSNCIGTKWVLFSRDNDIIRQRLEKEDDKGEQLCNVVFSKGLPQMSISDVELMIMNKIGNRKKEIIRLDSNESGKTENKFLEKVYELSEGNPLYIKYLIGDIISGKIRDIRKMDQLPQSVKKYNETLLTSCGVEITLHIAPMILTLIASVYEAATYEFIRTVFLKEALIQDSETGDTILDRSLQMISPLIKLVSLLDNKEGYLIYHSSVIDALSSGEFALIMEIQRTAFNRLLICPENYEDVELRTYFYRYSIRHLCEYFEQYRKEILEFMTNLNFTREKKAAQNYGDFIDELYLVTTKLMDAEIIDITNCFIDLIMEWEEFDINDFHQQIVYRDDKRFYLIFLEKIISISSGTNEKQLLANRANPYMKLVNLRRLMGNTDSAKELIEKLVNDPTIIIDTQCKCNIEYEKAMIHYLDGDLNSACYHMENRIAMDKELRGFEPDGLRNIVYFYRTLIPENLEKRGDNHTEVEEEYWAHLKRVEQRLIEKQKDQGDYIYLRDYYNCCDELFRLAILRGDKKESALYFEKIKNSKWVKRMYALRLKRYEALFNYVNEDYQSAVDCFKEYIDISPKHKTEEIITMYYYYYMKACRKIGDKMKFEEAVRLLNELPKGNGNIYFYREIDQAWGRV